MSSLVIMRFRPCLVVSGFRLLIDHQLQIGQLKYQKSIPPHSHTNVHKSCESKTPIFTGVDKQLGTFKQCAEQFDRFAEVDNLSKPDRAKCKFLMGYAEEVLRTILFKNPKLSDDYDGLRNALAQKLVPGEISDLFDHALINRQQRPTESVHEYASVLKQFARQAYGSLTTGNMPAQQMRDHTLIILFKRGVNPAIRKQVWMLKSTKTFDELVDASSLCEQAEKLFAGNRPQTGVYAELFNDNDGPANETRLTDRDRQWLSLLQQAITVLQSQKASDEPKTNINSVV